MRLGESPQLMHMQCLEGTQRSLSTQQVLQAAFLFIDILPGAIGPHIANAVCLHFSCTLPISVGITPFALFCGLACGACYAGLLRGTSANLRFVDRMFRHQIASKAASNGFDLFIWFFNRMSRAR